MGITVILTSIVGSPLHAEIRVLTLILLPHVDRSTNRYLILLCSHFVRVDIDLSYNLLSTRDICSNVISVDSEKLF